MTKLKPGDQVECRIKSAAIVSPYHSYDESKTFEVIAVDNGGCYLYVPHYYLVKGSVVLDAYRRKTLSIDPKFLGEQFVYILENLIANIHQQTDGVFCKVCNEFYQFAEPNRKDKTFICFSCRANPYR
jgi:hypothetical protein